MVTAWLLLLWVLGLFIFFRGFFLSAGDRVIGDPADGQLIQSIHEHWHRVLLGKDRWLDLGFFYPVSNTLGYSDTFLLSGIPYTMLRLFGMDMFLAFQLVQMLLATAGFFGMHAWLRRFRGIRPGFAAWGAFLFVIASPFFIASRNSHIQLLSVWLLPWLIILLEISLREARAFSWRFAGAFTGFAGGFGLLAYSTFYAAYFLMLLMLLALLSAMIIRGIRPVLDHIVPPRRAWPAMLPGLALFTVFSGLFLWTYLPVRQELGARSLATVLRALPQPWDFFNHSASNLLWGKVNGLLWPYPKQFSWELELGLPLLTLSLVLGCIHLALRQWQRGDRKSIACLLAAFVLAGGWMMMIRIGPASLWVLPYYLTPGGGAIRAVPRFNLALLIPALFLLCRFLQGLAMMSGPGIRLAGFLLAALVTIEQVQLLENTKISRRDRERMAAAGQPLPQDADAFLAVGSPVDGWNRDIPHNSAIHLSQCWNLPTLNGRSGFLAPGWPLYDMTPAVAFQNLPQWAEMNKIRGKVYLYDLDNGKWIRCIDFASTADRFSTGQDLMHLPPSEFRRIAVSGWSVQEYWGVWTEGPRAVLVFPRMHLEDREAVLEMTILAFVPAQSPTRKVRMLINDEHAAEIILTNSEPLRHVTLPINLNSEVLWTLVFEILNPTSPASLGLHGDPRQLGISLISLQVRRIEPSASLGPS